MISERNRMASMVCAKVQESGGEAFKIHCIIIIRSRGLYHRQFQSFPSDVDAKCGDVLYHSDVRWLSRGSVLQRFYSLRLEIDQFLRVKNQGVDELMDPQWLADLAFLVDLTGHLKELYTTFQGKDQLVSQLYGHLKAFCLKLRLFETQLINFNVVHFPTPAEVKSAFPNDNLSAKKSKYASVVKALLTEFDRRFQEFSAIENKIKLFSTPFLMDAQEVEESLQLELIEMQCDSSLRNQHHLLSLSDFYRSLEKTRFPLMIRNAKQMMSLFGSTYICEQTFSLLTLNKNKLRSKMTDNHLCDVLRLVTS